MADEKVEKKTDLLGMVDELEGLLHEELPAAARRVCDRQTHDDMAGTAHEALTPVVVKIEELQRKIGMATFEMIRRGEAPPALGRARFRDPYAERVAAADEPYEDPMESMRQGHAAAEAPPDTEPPVEAPRPRCTYCHVFAAGTCAGCDKPACNRHQDPANHPCGDM